MWQVTCNPSVVVAPSSGGNVSSSGFKRRPYTNSSATAGRQVHGKYHGIAGEKPEEVLLFLPTGEYCQHCKRQGYCIG